MRRVLAIDGGGIKGVFPAAFLAAIEERVGGRIGEYFDLICGTSTGGIIALGLASGLPAAEIFALYRDRASDIFPRGRGGWLRRLWRPRYDPTLLRCALEACFGSRTLADCDRRVVVPSQLLATGEVYIHKTPHHADLLMDGSRSLVDVALATSAAPTYFPVHRSGGCPQVIDGGTWANNPMGVAAVECVGKLGWTRGNVRMLSLGCTDELLDPRRVQQGWQGLVGWASHGLAVLMAGQTSGSTGTATVLLGSENVFRYSPPVPKGRFRLDGADGVGQLIELGQVEARKAVPKLLPLFFDERAERFSVSQNGAARSDSAVG